MARTIDIKAIEVRTQSHEKEHELVEKSLEANKFFPIKADTSPSSKPKVVGLFTGKGTGSETKEYKLALASLKNEISDYMFSNPDQSVVDIESGLKMFISHKMDRAGYSAEEASGMTTYVPGKNKFLDHLAQWNSKCFKAADQSNYNPRTALNYVFAEKKPNVQKQILAECMSTILMIKSYIMENKETIEKDILPQEVKNEAKKEVDIPPRAIEPVNQEIVQPLNDVNHIKQLPPENLENRSVIEAPQSEIPAPKVEVKVEEREQRRTDPTKVEGWKNKFVAHEEEQRKRIVNIVKNVAETERFNRFISDQQSIPRPDREISGPPEKNIREKEPVKVEEAYRLFQSLEQFQAQIEKLDGKKTEEKQVDSKRTEDSREHKIISKEIKKPKEDKDISKKPSVSIKPKGQGLLKKPAVVRTSVLRHGAVHYPETYPVTSKADFRFNLRGVNSPTRVFNKSHAFIAQTVRGDLKNKLREQYVSVEQHKANIREAENIKHNGTPEQKIALAKKWQEDYLSIVRNLEKISDDELTDLVLDKIIEDTELNNQRLKEAAWVAKDMNDLEAKHAVLEDADSKYLAAIQKEQNFAKYSDEECVDFAIDKYIKNQQIVQMEIIENSETKIQTNSIEQPRLDNMVRMLSETTRYHHMLAQAIFVRATYLELSSKTESKEKMEYEEIANKELDRIKRLANSPKEYAILYRGGEVEPNYNDSSMLKMFNIAIKAIAGADTEKQLQSTYDAVVEDWISRGHTISANMIADYAQELNIPQKYVKAFITHSDNHYEFANLDTPGNGMNCGLYSLLMLACAYYNPESREILDKLMNNKEYKFTKEDADKFNKAIQESQKHILVIILAKKRYGKP